MYSINNELKSSQIEVTPDQETLLYKSGEHAIYWLGIPEETAFRCNCYLIVDGKEAIIVDPGNRRYFDLVRKRVEKIIPVENVSGVILCHQDPDVAASMVDWLDINPDLKIITSARTNVLLPHYGKTDYSFYDISETYDYKFSSGRSLKFIEAPFLHFPGAITTFDNTAGFLFSGDIWAALDLDWKLLVDDFDDHIIKLNLFHLDYMPGNIAARGYIRNIQNIRIDAILPQHGSIIPQKYVQNALDYLNNLICGLDLLYPDLK